MRYLITFLLSASLFAGVTCKHPDGSGAVAFVVDSAGRGTCGSGFTRPTPVWYYIDAISYGFGSTLDTATAAFDKDVQAVFNDAHLGDKVLYTAGQEFIHGCGGGPRITRRPGTGTLEVTTTEYAKLPNSGTRITPAYAPLMPTIRTRAAKSGSQRGSNIFTFVGGPRSADHITLRGLRFTVKSDDDAFGFQFNGGLVNAGTTGRNYAEYLTTVTSQPVVGQNVVNVLSTDGFAVTDPPQQVVVDYASASPLYTVTGVNLDGPNTIRVSPNISQTGNSYKVWSILNREGESNLQPDDITVQHCMIVNPPPRVSISVLMGWNTRKTTVRDSWFFVHDTSSQNADEPKILQAAEGYGPYNIENNYFFGGMAWMHGGQFSSTHAHTLAGGLWRYNTFHLPEEYLFTNTWEVMFGADNPWKSTADMSVDGLPPQSPRYVVAGRSVDSAPSGHWYWAAYNSGVVGTSKPSCLDIASWPLSGSPTSVQTAYCYDSDPLRASRGTTYCPPQGIAGVTAVPNAGDGVCWQLQYSMNAIKNAWETKDSSNNTLQYNGFIGFPPVGGLNTGQYTVVNVKISSAYYGSTLNYPTIYKQAINSNFPATSSGCFFDLTAFPNPTTDDDGHVLPAGYSPWPFCERSHGDNIAIKNNYFRNISGGIQLVGYYTSGNGGHGMASGPWEVSGNLFSMRDPVEYGHGLLSVSSNSADEQNPGGLASSGPYQSPVNGVIIKNNTFYTPFNQTSANLRCPFWLAKVNATVTDLQIFNGTRVWSSNVWASLSQGSFYKQNASPGEGDWVSYFPGVSYSSGTATWGKNVALGAAQGVYRAAAYPAGTVWTGCPSGAKCAGADSLPTPDYSKVFVNPDKKDFRVKSDFTFGKRSQSGADLGADPDQVPMIKGLTVTPTDRSVLFQWRLTPVIQHIPCAIELHTAPDLETTNWAGTTTGYAGELANIATYYRRDADDYDGYYRDGNRRMIVLGPAANLTADTPYYYRLHCGGDMAVGMFRTLPALTSTATQTIARTATRTGVTNMIVEYGTAYSRATGAITGGGTSTPASCTKGNRCVATFSATRGTIVYYRWKERDDAGAPNVLLTGNVEVMPAL